jgi:hypothetical protein
MPAMLRVWCVGPDSIWKGSGRGRLIPGDVSSAAASHTPPHMHVSRFPPHLHAGCHVSVARGHHMPVCSHRLLPHGPPGKHATYPGARHGGEPWSAQHAHALGFGLAGSRAVRTDARQRNFSNLCWLFLHAAPPCTTTR